MSTQEPLMPQSLNGGMYKLQQRLPGGMGEVYLAHDTSLDRPVVVKLARIAKTTLDNNQTQQDALRKFRREVDTLSRARHPHVIEIYYCGQEEQGNDVLVYMVMPYCEEGSLQDWFNKHWVNKLLDVKDVATLLSQAGEALKHLHENGITHRDIKTTNFLVRDRSSDHSQLPHILLADFGLAQTIEEDTSQDSLGTYQYKAPEQWLKWGPPAPKTDQYQLAIMAYYLLTRVHPFDCDRNLPKDQRKAQLKEQHISVIATAPSTHRPDIPREVDKVILHALAKYPHERYPNILEFVNAFSKACRPGCLSLPGQIFKPIKTGRPKWARPVAPIVVALSIIAAIAGPLWIMRQHTPASHQKVPVTPSCSTNPFPITGSPDNLSLQPPQKAPDGEQIGLSVGGQFFDLNSNPDLQTQKIQIAHEIASGKSLQALSGLQYLTSRDSNEAEARIYQEDQTILIDRYPYIAIVLGLEFSPSLIGETHDALQAAYLAQKQWDNAASQSQPRLLLIVANAGDDSASYNMQNVVSQIIKWQQKNSNLIGIIGWEDSTRTSQAIQALSDQSLSKQSIPLLSPSASADGLTHLFGYDNFFRIVPLDSDQASFAVKFALNKWKNTKKVAIITTSEQSSTPTYITDLESSWEQDLSGNKVRVTQPQPYKFNQPPTIQTALSDALKTEPDLIFFSGYAHDLQTLLEAQSHNSDLNLRNIPVVAGDTASTMSDYSPQLPPGLDHTYFTSFASEETNRNADFFSIYRSTFPDFESLTHNINDVDENTILEYDAIEVLLHGYKYQQQNGKITLSDALIKMGACQGVSGRIAFGSSGNPQNKYIVLEQVLNGKQLKVLDQRGSY
jgi:serine/threonine protein kinase/ABC-type branched-subunit amino acid transport system substrate-binding protein